ncbi:type IV pilus biogenesis/stability protein PilW [Xanthomonas translucens]|uniref:type IV pilus biogenesis/stability protein PilW n=1 Tax=Xanthomonas campestris pv. translucens TaxID=343 RepID=UPI0002A79548|nr:type IV pilus biogenesis/stability protein PilW [Xanthomonas translucens]ELQ10003.1 fimbrial biogenesis protein [Xanthomonas translucens DAR61454]MBC3972132.1 type IV pilus biogenesis/stability protein PilW [Xanthomonas translucens pv. undulosa]MCT8280878.1 type IV pilus biogenesis/stability protein PilW [Xanthomonas translucens pv. undulosa]MCT8315810.1 type IV pilus biogenesis/stability protein PilW [Xanthomonas translucens pv. undulosa]QEN93560.1 type IV pilus biogenesis/stability protei
MRRPRHALSIALSVAALLALSACAARSSKPGKLRSVEQVAPDYDFRDNGQVKARYALQEQLGLAGNRLSGGDLAGAADRARKALALAPESVQAHTLLAVVAGRRGDAVTAGEHYRKAAELAPNRGETLNNYGAWLCANGAIAESLQWFDRALAAPGYATPASALANAGGCALQIGQRERGVRDLRKALALQPDNAYALEAMARDEAAQTRFFEARAFSERRLSAAPATASVLQLAIQIEQGLGDMAAAGRYQQRLRKEFPDAATTTPGASAL